LISGSVISLIHSKPCGPAIKPARPLNCTANRSRTFFSPIPSVLGGLPAAMVLVTRSTIVPGAFSTATRTVTGP